MMSQTIWHITYKLVEGASIQEYLAASEQVNNEILSKQRGFVSWQVLSADDVWVDLVTWETLDDAKSAETAGAENPVAAKYYSLIDMASCKMTYCTIEKSYWSCDEWLEWAIIPIPAIAIW